MPYMDAMGGAEPAFLYPKYFGHITGMEVSATLLRSVVKLSLVQHWHLFHMLMLDKTYLLKE